MKIAIVAEPYVAVPPPKYGGTEQVIGQLINGLQEMGHEVTLIGPGDSTVNCTILPSVDKALGFPRRKSDWAAYNKQLKAAMKATYHLVKSVQNKVDIIHSHGFDMLSFRSFPNVTTIHNPLIFELIPYYVRRLQLRYICISSNQTKVLPNLNTIGVAYNGLNPNEFPIVEKPRDYVVFIGRFDREKNPHLAIKLALSLGIKIKLAGKLDHLGDGYFEEEIEPHLKNPLVEYLGEIGFDEKIELLSNAKCNFHPTGFREPFGLTVLEAAYCGTPTLAISRGSMPELILDNKTGVLVEDFEEGYSAFERCIKLDRNFIADHARRTFNYQNMARDYVKLYQKAIDDFHHRGILDRIRGWLAPQYEFKNQG
ncbi:MAG: glycosyltransferase family 4 protein [bacterium]|nr:glycosyltransferase family 4 protein [bacterium]